MWYLLSKVGLLKQEKTDFLRYIFFFLFGWTSKTFFVTEGKFNYFNPEKRSHYLFLLLIEITAFWGVPFCLYLDSKSIDVLDRNIFESEFKEKKRMVSDGITD
jgi:hypothetical protein